MADRSWTFKQLHGDKKILTLSGWSAPFGRPRQQAVVRNPIEIRHKSTRYPGTDSPPTRHLFGVNFPDWEINGRFRDRELGKGGALKKMEFIKTFVKDQQVCDISWGNFLHITGIISEFDPGMESEGEIEWKMKILVDQDNSTQITQDNQIQKFHTAPTDAIAKALLKIDKITKITTVPDVAGVLTNILDSLDDLISVVTGAFGQLADLASLMGDLESGLANEAKRLIAGVHQAKTALLTLIHTTESVQQDAFFIRNSAQDTINFNAYSTQAMLEAMESLALLSDLENQAIVAERGRSSINVRVRAGDTWESISTRVYGGPGEANAIRAANGARFGSKPQVGALVQIPSV